MKILVKIDPGCPRRRCCSMNLVSDSVRFRWIFAEFPGEGASNDSGVVENGNFQYFTSLTISLEALEIRPTLLYIIINSIVAFPLSPTYVT